MASSAVTVATKGWWTSKTIWVNALTFVSMLSVVLAGVKLSASGLEVVGAIVAAANILLRLVTGQPVTATGAALSAPK